MDQPPLYTDPQLAEYLTRVLTMLENNINNSHGEATMLTAIPFKPQVGKVYYFKNTVTPTITQIGFWGYASTGWVLLG